MEKHHHSTEGNIKIAFGINILFTCIELVGGLYTNSLAILSDAMHDFGDSISLGTSWYFERVSKKPRSESFTYGYKRFSLIGAFISSIVLISGSLLILSEAVPRLLAPEHTDAKGMFILAVVGILLNGLTALRLRSGKGLTEKVLTWHMMEDVLGWVAVLVTSIVMSIQDTHILDPILSILITLFVLSKVLKNLKSVVKVFLQGVPDNLKIKEIEKSLLGIKGVLTVHDSHVWSLDGEESVLTSHLIVENALSEERVFEVKCDAKQLLLQSYGIPHATLELERGKEECNLEKC
ncbi:cation transporter [Candidatus Peregrinibacteria bacterium]|nr:MAG: cation transporter [Candidatus Peregrinibacteria bacterium]